MRAGAGVLALSVSLLACSLPGCGSSRSNGASSQGIHREAPHRISQARVALSRLPFEVALDQLGLTRGVFRGTFSLGSERLTFYLVVNRVPPISLSRKISRGLEAVPLTESYTVFWPPEGEWPRFARQQLVRELAIERALCRATSEACST